MRPDCPMLMRITLAISLLVLLCAMAPSALAQNQRERERAEQRRQEREQREQRQREREIAETLADASDYNGKRPNIIFLLADDLRQDTLGCYGNKIVQSPNIDKLARRGLVFDNAFVTTSICAISRASILTGQFASVHGIQDFTTSLSPEQLSQTYPALLKASGYYTGFVGKWGVGGKPEGLFDFEKAWGFNGDQGNYFPEGPNGRHLTRIEGDHVMEFLDSAPKDRPFCLSVSFKAPHVQDTGSVYANSFPYDPALASMYSDVTIPPPPAADPKYFEALPDFLKNSEGRARWAVRFWGPAKYQESVKGYYRLITGIDSVVGRILEKLQAKGLSDNTVIIFTSDNGFFLGEKGLAGKWLAYEPSIRVPLIVYDPHPKARHGERAHRLVLNIDIARTMCGYAGVVKPQSMQGRALKAVTRSDLKLELRDYIYYEHLFESPTIPKTRAVRTERWKYIRYVGPDRDTDELYDLQADPHELNNLVRDPQHASVVRELGDTLERVRNRLREEE